MKFLCICQYGHSRSVALCRVLHGLGHSAVAIGAGTSGDAIGSLAPWADKILTLQPGFGRIVPPDHFHKVIEFDVGPDRWVNPYHPELHAILSGMVKEKLGL